MVFFYLNFNFALVSEFMNKRYIGTKKQCEKMSVENQNHHDMNN